MTTSKGSRTEHTTSADQTDADPIVPLTLYGPGPSYFTRKLESVIRFMELPYKRLNLPPPALQGPTGVSQVPGLSLADGRWLTDSTPIIAWLHERYPNYAVIPNDPVVGFFSRLVEDYVDEWLWRPAMHYRWDYEMGSKHMSHLLIDLVGRDIALALPMFIKRYFLINRQRAVFTYGDGVSADTWDHVEGIYLGTLKHLTGILEKRPYLLGTRPTLVDFSFFGPFFGHFSQDPVSATILRDTAPAVYEWIGRVWNSRASVTQGEVLDHVPDDWGPILDSIGSAYLPYLCANAEAWKAGQTHFDADIEDAPYRNIRTAQYRVWCLEELRRHFTELAEPDQDKARALLEAHGCWEPLWRISNPSSGQNSQGKAPFGGSVSQTGIPAGIDSETQLYLRPKPVKTTRLLTENLMGNTALITGASSGIGTAFARLHASKCGDLVLVARRKEALESLKAELEKKYPIAVTVIVADLAAPGAAQKVFAATEAAGLQVDVLINNAGLGGHGKFHERDLAKDQAMMQVNMAALVELTHLFLAGMVKRRSGKILHVASTAGMLPGPLQAVYFATKSFVISFSQAIAEELKDTGVTSTALCPGAVDTGFAKASDLEGTALFQKPGASPESVAKCGYEAILKGELVKINEPSLNFALNWLIPLLPRKAVLKMSRTTMEKSKPAGRAAPHRLLRTLTKVHVFMHRLVGGRAFNTLSGQDVCFVTMTGAKSGREITVPLIHVPNGDGVLLVASQTGRDKNPMWYNNIAKNPDIEVRHRRNNLKLRARVASNDEKTQLWQICDDTYSEFAVYRKRTTRDIPIFICEKY